MRNIIALIKLLYFAFCCFFYILFGLPFTFLVERFPIITRKFTTKNIQIAGFFMLRGIGIRLKVSGNKNNLKTKETQLIIGNHQSYLDMLIFSSVHASCYVTSVEVKEMIGLGFLSKLGGSLYVERRNKTNLSNEINQLTHGLQNGLDITVFPEATSTNGDEVIRFRRPLFNAALSAKKNILPFSINYRKINGEEVTTKNRDLVCWYGDMEFFPHFWEFLKCKTVEVEVIIGEPIVLQNEWEAADLALISHEKVCELYTPIRLA